MPQLKKKKSFLLLFLWKKIAWSVEPWNSWADFIIFYNKKIWELEEFYILKIIAGNFGTKLNSGAMIKTKSDRI